MMMFECEMEVIFEVVFFVILEFVQLNKFLLFFFDWEQEQVEVVFERVFECYCIFEESDEEFDCGVMFDEVVGGVWFVICLELYGFFRCFFEISGLNKLIMVGFEILVIIVYW